MNVICKHCGSNIMVKDGKIAGKQRWKCTKCHKTTREGDGRNKYPMEKRFWLLNYIAKKRALMKYLASLVHRELWYYIGSKITKKL